MSKWSKYSKTVYDIIGSAMEVHTELHWGLLESIYQEALCLELKNRGYNPEREKEIKTYYKNTLLDKRYRMDIVVDDIVVELKSVSGIQPIHRAQLCNYLRLTKMPVGLLINFGEAKLFGERWVYDSEVHDCFLADRQLELVDDVDYTSLLDYFDDDENIQI